MLLRKQLGATEPSGLRILQYLVLGSLALYFGRDLFIPVSFALLISFVLYPVCAWLERKGFSKITAIILALSLLLMSGLLIVGLLIMQFIGFLDEWPTIQLKLSHATTELSQMLRDVFGLTQEEQQQYIAKITDQSGSSLLRIVSSAASASA